MIGETISHYRIKSKIGEGGMGQVYLAEDTRLGRSVALKFVPDHIRGDQTARERLLREATAASKLNHANIVSLYDIGEADGSDFIVMEYVEGRPLSEIIQSGDVGLETALNLTKQICRALATAHDNNVVHRDIKPDNILVTDAGEVKVLDFGLAKVEGAGGLTDDGSTVGTQAYMAPEQIQGRDVDGRADLFSLGVLLYEMLAGRLPFQGEHRAAVTYAIMNEEPEPLARYKAGVPDELDRITRKLLHKDRGTRYQTAAGLMSDLDCFQRVPGPTASKRRRGGRVSTVAAVVVTAAAVMLAVYFAVLSRRGGPADTGVPKIAVLPFENLGPEDESYFADGITEEITARLASVQGVRVIARTSVLQDKNTQKTIPQIGDELDVRFVLEGTVRWQHAPGGESRVRVTPQLIRVADATHIWADVYDEPMTAVFEVQSDIATSVIQELNVALLDSDRSIVEAVPTRNLEAYNFYLRGLDYRRADLSQSELYFVAVSMFEKTVSLDDQFAEAYAHLSMAHGDLRWFRLDPVPERLAAAKTAVDRAVELDPDGPLTHLALGYYCYFGTLDYDGALAHFENARRVQPSSKDAHSSIGFVKRRQGKWDEAVKNLKLAAELDPFDVSITRDLAFTLSMMKRFEEAAAYLERAIELAPEQAGSYGLLSLNQVLEGNLEDARASAEAIPADADLKGLHLMLVSSLERKFDECLAHLSHVRRLPMSWAHLQYYPIQMLIARFHEVSGRTEQAIAGYDSSRTHLEAMASQYPEDARVRGSLGIVYAKLGRREDALREGMRAVELMPVAVDAVRGPSRRVELAEIYMIVGDIDRSVDELELLLETPGSYVTLPRLRLDPMWDPLRGFPRFEKLIEQ